MPDHRTTGRALAEVFARGLVRGSGRRLMLEVHVHMDGGDARVRLHHPSQGRVTLVGPAQYVATVIVEIDERSLDARGQWPWPRTLTADLLRAIAAAGPAAIGVDMLFTEPDRSAAGADAQLAAAVQSAPTVLALAGLENRDRRFPFPPQRRAANRSGEMRREMGKGV